MLRAQSVIGQASLERFNRLGDRSAGEDAAWMPSGPARGEKGRGRLASRSAYGLRGGMRSSMFDEVCDTGNLSGAEHIVSIILSFLKWVC